MNFAEKNQLERLAKDVSKLKWGMIVQWSVLLATAAASFLAAYSLVKHTHWM